MTPQDFMREAARLAQEGMDTGKGGPFGAVIVENGQIIGRGCNLVTSANDPTAHAEVTAIRQACAARGDFSLAGCELYTSCEPCPMCLAAIYWARLDRIYYANTRDDAARIGFDDALIYKEVALPTEARTLPMHPLPLKEALAAFEAWASKPDKTDY